MTVEDQTVRQYRFLLRTAPLDALQAAHLEALGTMGPGHREAVLRAVQDGLVAGGRLTADDIGALARLVTIGERRDPGAFLAACDGLVRHSLAAAVIESEAVFGLFGGYADWDGLDPEPAFLGDHHDTYLGPDEGRYAGEIKAVEGAFIQRHVSSGGAF